MSTDAARRHAIRGLADRHAAMMQDGGMTDDGTLLTRTAASAAVSDLGWRYILGTLMATVPVASLVAAAQVGATAAAACGVAGDGHLRIDLRSDHVELTLQSAAQAGVTRQDVSLAGLISAAVSDITPVGPARSVQLLEIAIDAVDIATIRPFWKAVMGYADEAGKAGPQDALIDPAWQSPAIWFQQMDVPRRQRNRIHFDISVPHEEAQQRIQSAIAAGGIVLSDSAAPAFWVLADAEGNEVCITTGRAAIPHRGNRGGCAIPRIRSYAAPAKRLSGLLGW